MISRRAVLGMLVAAPLALLFGRPKPDPPDSGGFIVPPEFETAIVRMASMPGVVLYGRPVTICCNSKRGRPDSNRQPPDRQSGLSTLAMPTTSPALGGDSDLAAGGSLRITSPRYDPLATCRPRPGSDRAKRWPVPKLQLHHCLGLATGRPAPENGRSHIL